MVKTSPCKDFPHCWRLSASSGSCFALLNFFVSILSGTFDTVYDLVLDRSEPRGRRRCCSTASECVREPRRTARANAISGEAKRAGRYGTSAVALDRVRRSPFFGDAWLPGQLEDPCAGTGARLAGALAHGARRVGVLGGARPGRRGSSRSSRRFDAPPVRDLLDRYSLRERPLRAVTYRRPQRAPRVCSTAFRRLHARGARTDGPGAHWSLAGEQTLLNVQEVDRGDSVTGCSW